MTNQYSTATVKVFMTVEIEDANAKCAALDLRRICNTKGLDGECPMGIFKCPHDGRCTTVTTDEWLKHLMEVRRNG